MNLRLQRFVMAIPGAGRVMDGRRWRRGEARPRFPWLEVGLAQDEMGYRDEYLYVICPLNLLFLVRPTWNRRVLTPLINCGVLALEEGDYFHNARMQPVSRWFTVSRGY